MRLLFSLDGALTSLRVTNPACLILQSGILATNLKQDRIEKLKDLVDNYSRKVYAMYGHLLIASKTSWQCHLVPLRWPA
jgi:hypothetical protein